MSVQDEINDFNKEYDFKLADQVVAADDNEVAKLKGFLAEAPANLPIQIRAYDLMALIKRIEELSKKL